MMVGASTRADDVLSWSGLGNVLRDVTDLLAYLVPLGRLISTTVRTDRRVRTTDERLSRTEDPAYLSVHIYRTPPKFKAAL
jgi:hypothetical protein